jgi:ATP-dependent DNA helicase RecQ
MVMASKETLYDFQIKNPKYEPLIKAVLRSYTGLFEQFVYINEKDLVYKVKLSYPELIQQIELLAKHEIWSYIPTSNLPKLTFLQSRMPHKLITLDPENYKVLKDNHCRRIESLIDFLEDENTCRQAKLLSYFNEFTNESCGYCDVCLSVKTPNTELCKKKLLTVIGEKPKTIIELKEEMIDFNLKLWTRALGELVESNQLHFNDYHYSIKG